MEKVEIKVAQPTAHPTVSETERVELKGHIFEIQPWTWREKNRASSIAIAHFPDITSGKRRQLTEEESGEYTALFNLKMLEVCVLTIDGAPAGEVLGPLVLDNRKESNLGDDLVAQVQRVNRMRQEDQGFLQKSSTETSTPLTTFSPETSGGQKA